MKPSKPAKINLTNIRKFIQGWYRFIVYKLSEKKYLSKVSEELPFIANDKVEQFKYRLTVMNKECLKSGSCIICGCYTPQLQMTDASCEGNCYPPMMNKQEWEKYKE